jgi:tungstate transport system ATP-binding protein
VASFVGVETILPGRVVSRNNITSVVFAGGQNIEVVGPQQTGEEVILCIRPEHVTLSAPGSEPLSGMSNLLTGMVEKITSMGPYQKVQLNCGFPLVTYLTRHTLSGLSLKQGTEVLASFDAMAVHTIRKGSSVEHECF